MEEKLIDYKFLYLSRPIENTWLKNLEKYNLSYIVGNGVTAKEYACILKRANIEHKVINVNSILQNPSSYTNGFVVLACPKDRSKLVKFMKDFGFIKGVDYDSFFNLIRNRAVFDLRNSCFEFSIDKWVNTTKHLESISTIGGIDILLNSKNLMELPSSVSSNFFKLQETFHLKVAIELISKLELSTLLKLNVDLIELIVRPDSIKFFDPTLIDEWIAEELDFNIHVIFSGIEIPMHKYNFSYEYQSLHPRSFDTYLSERLAKDFNFEDNLSTCTSRRMFPAFDKNLNLKACSLYEYIGLFNYDFSMMHSKSFVDIRNSLCKKCISVNLHRS